MTRSPRKKLVLAWVDHTGFELTGRFRDALRHYPETRAVPEAQAACWGENTPALLARIHTHIEKEKFNHAWMGFFILDYNNSILNLAREKALAAIGAEKSRLITSGSPREIAG